MAKAREITEALEQWAPLHWGEEWDNNGYITGHPEALIDHVIIALDVTTRLVSGARPGSLILCHHPPVLPRDLSSLRRDRPAGELLSAAIEKGLVVYAAHTNLDRAPGGTADALAAHLGLTEVRPWDEGRKEPYTKLVVFVPSGYENQLRDALSRAGAGWIGHYSHCTYQSLGQGTFMPRAGSDPFLGREGDLEKVDEYRLETIVPPGLVPCVLEAMHEVHPYEEVAYDLYPLLNPGVVRAYGRSGRWPQAGTLSELAQHVAHALEWNGVRVAGDLSRRVEHVAVAPGAGGGQIAQARHSQAEVLVTGEIGYHQVQLALAQNLAIIDAGHEATERPVLAVLAAWLERSIPAVGREIWSEPPLLRAWSGPVGQR